MQIDQEQFVLLCGGDRLTPGQRTGLIQVVNFIANDAEITDIRWAAYMLATIDRECGHEWHPIEEYSKGKGEPYGKVVNGHTYYGRGYVQLTWDYNYKAMSNPTGRDLLAHPEAVLEPEIAYRIMSYGMRNGSFTGAKLGKYIKGTKCDYVNARRIINGTDQAKAIARSAVWFEAVIKKCVKEN